MSGGGDRPPPGTPTRSMPVLGWRGRLAALQRRALRTPAVLAVMHVTRAYDRSGGGLLAGALAYYAFFSFVPALLLLVSLLGLVVQDAALRKRLIDGLIDQVDPIRDVAVAVIEGLADSSRTGTIVGLLGLLWAASGFYGSLQGAMQRMFPGPGGRDFLSTRLRGIVAVGGVLGILLLSVGAIFALPFVSEWVERRCADLDGFDLVLIVEVCRIDFGQVAAAVAVVGAMGIAFLAALVVYVAIATDGPTVRQAFWPALIAGIIIGLLTALFGWVAPFLARTWLALGIVGGVFIALLWLNLTFQVLLYGAAFARLRRDRDRTTAASVRVP